MIDNAEKRFCLWWWATLLKRLPWQGTFSTHLTGTCFFSAFFHHSWDVPLSPTSTDWEVNEQNSEKGDQIKRCWLVCCALSFHNIHKGRNGIGKEASKREVERGRRGFKTWKEKCENGRNSERMNEKILDEEVASRCKASSSHLALFPAASHNPEYF